MAESLAEAINEPKPTNPVHEEALKAEEYGTCPYSFDGTARCLTDVPMDFECLAECMKHNGGERL